MLLFETRKQAWARNQAAQRMASAVDAVLVPGCIYRLPSGQLARYRFLSKQHVLEFVLVESETHDDRKKGDLSLSPAYAARVTPLKEGGAT